MTEDGVQIRIAGEWSPSEFLEAQSGGIVIPSCLTSPDAVTMVLVQVESAETVAPTLRLVKSLLPDGVTSSMKVRSAVDEATTSLEVGATLNSFSRADFLMTTIAVGAAVAFVQCGLVFLRRRDFGRRRALGASRALVVGLVMGETVLVVAVGAVVGTLTASVALWAATGSSTSPALATSLVVLLLAVSGLFSLVPALLASRFDPAREMRVP